MKSDCYRHSAQNDSMFIKQHTLSLKKTLLCISVSALLCEKQTKKKQQYYPYRLAGLFYFICHAYIKTLHKNNMKLLTKVYIKQI